MKTTTGSCGSQSYTFNYAAQRNRVRTFCALRLGDNLAHLHFLRALAVRHPELTFEHAAHRCYLPDLIEVVADLPNVVLRDLAHVDASECVNAWKNVAGFWESHPLKNDYGEFMLDWFRVLACRLGLESPFSSPSDLWFSYPALDAQPREFDGVLFINSRAMSGQWLASDYAGLDALAVELSKSVATVVTHQVAGLYRTQGTITAIGQLRPRAIVMVSTGPSWPTFSVFNREYVKHRIALLTHERLTFDPNCHHAATVADARRLLVEFGYLSA